MQHQATTPTASEGLEKERFALLLDINHELLYESIQIQAAQQERKKEHSAEVNQGERKPTEEENLLQQDYLQYVLMTTVRLEVQYMANSTSPADVCAGCR